MSGINVYVREELEADHRTLLGVLPFDEFTLDPVATIAKWCLRHDNAASGGIYGNASPGALTGQFFVDEETGEAGFEVVLHDDGEASR